MEPTRELFEKVYIRSEKDLPKERGEYYAYFRGSEKIQLASFDNNSKFPFERAEVWMNNFDWYLQPVEQEKQTQKNMNAFDKLVKDLDSGELNLRLLELAYREHIRKRKDIPEGAKNLLVRKEGAGLISFAQHIGEIVGNIELAYRRGMSK